MLDDEWMDDDDDDVVVFAEVEMTELRSL